MATLNRRNELVSSCRYANKFLLKILTTENLDYGLNLDYGYMYIAYPTWGANWSVRKFRFINTLS